jgi:hypothetical protein
MPLLVIRVAVSGITNTIKPLSDSLSVRYAREELLPEQGPPVRTIMETGSINREFLYMLYPGFKCDKLVRGKYIIRWHGNQGMSFRDLS